MGSPTRLKRARHRREEPSAAHKEARRGRPSLRGVQALAYRAIARGGRLRAAGNALSVSWDVAPHCERPYVRAVHASNARRLESARTRALPKHSASVEISTPCRRCASCIEQRRRLWTARAISETTAAPESWFGTLTFEPEVLNDVTWRIREEARQDGYDFDALTPSTAFSKRLERLGPYCRKYIAALRRELPCPIVGDDRLPNLRYLLVAENDPGKDRVHFHVLLHVVHATDPIPCELIPGHELKGWTYPFVLQNLWGHGFSKWKRAVAGHASYICKYLAKDADNRVRASLNYGAFDYMAVNSLRIDQLRSNSIRVVSESERNTNWCEDDRPPNKCIQKET